MRPRVFPAEDAVGPENDRHILEASMRPRVFPAEDPVGPHVGEPGRLASMRPRVFPAEDLRRLRRCRWCCRRFNEAAGIPRGRRRLAGVRIFLITVASMRPRVFPAEDARRGAAEPDRPWLASMRPRVFPAEDVTV